LSSNDYGDNLKIASQQREQREQSRGSRVHSVVFGETLRVQGYQGAAPLPLGLLALSPSPRLPVLGALPGLIPVDEKKRYRASQL
jgi:hypothetical protein